jgi:INO80 complex subunit C
MAPITTASDESNHMALLDKLDMQKIHKPFRNPRWKPAQRRNKTVKQVVSEAQRKEQQLLQQSVQATRNNSAAGTPQPESALPISDAQPAAAAAQQPLATPSYTYTSIQAAPSFKPKQKYCDITGLPAPYSDPKTGLRYHNTEVYSVIRTLNTTQVQEILAARGAHTVLK